MARLKRLCLRGASALCLAGAAFFAFYTVRLLYINVARNGEFVRAPGMLVGAVAFPVASAVLGWLAIRCLRAAGA